MKIEVKVKPGSSKSEFKDGIAYLKERPEKGKANIELIKILKKHFKAKEVLISRGLKSKKKVIEIK